MLGRSLARQHGARNAGIALLILSLVHTPLPEPDYHNLRHHDGPGEVCEHHDHLLRWHPGAGIAQDVAVLHWHWYLPSSPSDDSGVPGDGPALHAHVPDWQATPWDQVPTITPDTSSRFSARTTSQSNASPLWVNISPTPGPLRAAAARSPSPFGATFARQHSGASLLQRWDC